MGVLSIKYVLIKHKRKLKTSQNTTKRDMSGNA